jgi:hypothetical protein
MGYIREINKKYITEFKNRLSSGFKALIRSSDSMYMRTILKEINRLFRIISGRLSSRHDIPNATDFPDTIRFNRLLEDVDTDIDKVYTAQALIESDVQNLVNFNSLEREKQINNLTRVQKQVYSVYVKSKKGVIGTTIIREDFKDEHLSKESSGVEVNMTKEALQLSTLSLNINRNIVDTAFVECVFIETPNEKYNLYPNNRILSLGSFWKKASNDPHFMGKDNINYYRSLMIDDPNTANVSSTQFEAVYTFDENKVVGPFTQASAIREKVETELSNYFQLHPSFIMVDKANSLNGKYTSTNNIENDPDQAVTQPNIRLSIPFKNNAPVSTSMVIDFEPNDANIIPTIDLTNSFARDNKGNNNKFIAIDAKKQATYSGTGRVQIDFKEAIVPTRVDLSLSYTNSAWALLKEYMMSGYVFEKRKTFELNTNDGSSITATLTKIAWVFVDSESNLHKEEEKANIVMNLTGVNK